MGRIMLRNSERQAFKTCRHRWQWTYLDGRQAASAPTALRFGDLIHQALAAYYKPGRKRGPKPAATFERLYNEQARRLADQGFDVFGDEKWEPALDLGIGMLEGYVPEYLEADKEYEVISTEQTFQLRIRHPLGFVFYVVGTFDGVWRHLPTKRIKFKEFKTAAAIKTDGLPMDEQASTYWTYGPKWLRQKKILLPSEMPAEILYTFLRKARPDPTATYNAQGHKLNLPKKDVLQEAFEAKFKKPPGKMTVDDLMSAIGREAALQMGEVSKTQPAPYFHREPVYRDEIDRTRQHNRLLVEMAAIQAARAKGADPLLNIKNPGPLHMPNCLGCAVREACELHEAGGDFTSMLKATMIKWDPYASHEIIERH